MRKFLSLFGIYLFFLFTNCGFFTDDNAVSGNWKALLLNSSSIKNGTWTYKAHGNASATELNVQFQKTSGDKDEPFGFIFNFKDYKNYCAFYITNEGKYSLYEYVDGSIVDATKKENQAGITLNAGVGSKNVITAKIISNNVYLYANIEKGDVASEYLLTSLPYVEENLSNIIFAAKAGANENLSKTPMRVYVEILPNDDETPAEATPSEYIDGWQTEGEYEIYYTANTKKYYSCDFKVLVDDFDGLPNDDIRQFSFEMNKETGAFNYGGGVAFACSDFEKKTGNPRKYYLFSIDTNGNWKIIKVANSDPKEAQKEIGEFTYTENSSATVASKYITGFNKANKFTIRRMNEVTEEGSGYYSWYIWINNDTEITNENAESMKDEASLKIIDISDTAKTMISGLVAFAPGVGSPAYEDLPYYPVKYKFKNIIPIEIEEEP